MIKNERFTNTRAIRRKYSSSWAILSAVNIIIADAKRGSWQLNEAPAMHVDVCRDLLKNFKVGE